ncbi:Facilitated trehalose transporter Tret1-2 [Orchesella cincta]|uniref:Facilitated trehalose transporter Tret1-2 n=1 Tax=Orchesella cincta TaxID=48709 RepID=A0A1D2M2Y4_ORCCI|nr:Facilitated trehalose transporter Tret1-2 [Orchesella cincta]
MILVGRFLTGFCSGVYAVAAPIFTAEMADVSIRGTLCAGFDMMNYVYGAFVSWRMQALISAILPVIIFVMMLFVPESPRYLVQKGKTLEATSALLRFRGAYFKEQVDPELRVLKISVRNSQEKSCGWRDLMQLPVIRPISIAFIIYFFQVFSGIDPVLFYTVDIFSSSGANIDEYYSTIIIGSVQVIFATAGAFLVEYFGRRILLMISEMSMVCSFAVLGYYFFLKQQNGGVSPDGLGWLPLTSLIIYVVAYSIGVGPVGYMIMGEILPHHVKGIAGCVLTSAKWFMSFAMTKFFLDIINLLGNAGCYWLFGGFCLLGFFYIFFFFPETKGKTLDEIQQEFADSYIRGPRRSQSQMDATTPLLSPADASYSTSTNPGGYQSLREGNYA